MWVNSIELFLFFVVFYFFSIFLIFFENFFLEIYYWYSFVFYLCDYGLNFLGVGENYGEIGVGELW